MTKGRTIILLALFAAVCLVLATQEWVSVTLPDSGVQQELLSVPGTSASQGVTALGVVAAAAAIAAGIAKRVGRYICLGIVVAAMAAVSGLSVSAALQPGAAAATTIAEKIGLSGHAVGAQSHATFWPWVCAVTAALGCLLGLYAVVRSRTWVTTAKYEGQGQGAAQDSERRRRDEYNRSKGRSTINTRQATSIDDWDDLTRGDDPTA